MKLITLTEEFKEEWKSLIKEFEDVGEKITPLAMKGNAETFEEFLLESEKNSKGISLPIGYVPADIYFLIKDGDKRLIGAIDIRHELNEHLVKYGGNIGYGVRPSERQKGYATIMLALALEKCKEMEMTKVLITCFKDNVASARTMIKNGGILENEILEENRIKQRFWFQ